MEDRRITMSIVSVLTKQGKTLDHEVKEEVSVIWNILKSDAPYRAYTNLDANISTKAYCFIKLTTPTGKSLIINTRFIYQITDETQK